MSTTLLYLPADVLRDLFGRVRCNVQGRFVCRYLRATLPFFKHDKKCHRRVKLGVCPRCGGGHPEMSFGVDSFACTCTKCSTCKLVHDCIRYGWATVAHWLFRMHAPVGNISPEQNRVWINNGLPLVFIKIWHVKWWVVAMRSGSIPLTEELVLRTPVDSVGGATFGYPSQVPYAGKYGHLELLKLLWERGWGFPGVESAAFRELVVWTLLHRQYRVTHWILRTCVLEAGKQLPAEGFWISSDYGCLVCYSADMSLIRLAIACSVSNPFPKLTPSTMECILNNTVSNRHDKTASEEAVQETITWLWDLWALDDSTASAILRNVSTVFRWPLCTRRKVPGWWDAWMQARLPKTHTPTPQNPVPAPPQQTTSPEPHPKRRCRR